MTTAAESLAALHALLAEAEYTDAEGAVDAEVAVARVAERIDAARARGGKVLLFGNGGSAAVVGHMQADLSNSMGVRALVFDEAPRLTALANDHGYGRVFEQPVLLWADAGDVVVAVSSSGRSENIVRGVRAALARECFVVTLTGFAPDNPLRELGALNVWVRSSSYGHVEVAHAAITHLFTDRLLAVTRGAHRDGGGAAR